MMSAGGGRGGSGRVWTAAVAVTAGALGAGVGAAAAALAFVWRKAWGVTGGVRPATTTPAPAPPSNDDQAHIAAVLALWFGGGDVEDNYRHKWFCSPGSERQRAFDAQVHDAFAPLLLSLYHDDRRTAHKWRSSPRGTLALIVLFDQLARHIHRHVESRSLSSFPLTKAQTDAKALRFAEEMEGKGWLAGGAAPAAAAAATGAAAAATAARAGETAAVPAAAAAREGETAAPKAAREGQEAAALSSSSFDHHQVVLSPPELVFVLMPWRHAPTVDRLRRVLAQVDERVQLEEQHSRLLQRFRKTTLRRLQELEDWARAAAADDILEHHPFRPSDDVAASLPRHPVTLAVKSYLDARYGGGGDGGGSQESSPAPAPAALAVSLSGGVDSMVLARLLVHLAPQYGNPAILALHLDYGNRAESGQEAAYVERWCGEWGIAFRKRVVGEVTRGVTAREEYEAVTRDIRYGFYREALAQYNCPAILLGHHQGDVQENVLSNAMRGVGALHLSGMGQFSTINGVSVHRPLLPLDKAAILDFAHKFGVPYFKDTTPTWSTRGKLRRQLLPLLADLYGGGVHRNLARLATESDQLRALVAAHILQPFWASVTHTPLAAYVSCLGYRGQSALFWREALSSLLHERGQAMLTDKGVALLVRRLEECDPSDPDTEVWCQLRKEYAVLLHGKGPTLFLFRPGAVRHWDQRPCAKAAEVALDAYLPTLTVCIGAPALIRMGAWEVRALSCTESGEEEEELTTLEGFCRGHFCYSVLLSPCDNCGALPVLRVRGQQSKVDSGGRGYKGLGSFQGLPLKVKRSIPVVIPICPRCCDHAAGGGSAAATGGVAGAGGGGVGTAGGKRRVRVCYRFVGPAGYGGSEG